MSFFISLISASGFFSIGGLFNLVMVALDEDRTPISFFNGGRHNAGGIFRRTLFGIAYLRAGDFKA